MAPPRVLVVDDSALMRQMLTRRLGEAGVEVIGTARDGLDALDKIARLAPDVVTLDVEMPRLDGLGTLERLMAEHPVPVVMCSSLTRAGADATIRALELGAVDFVAKPTDGQVAEMIADLVVKIRAAASARVGQRPENDEGTAHRVRSPPAGGIGRIVIVAASTGGPSALNQLLPQLPGTLSASLLIVQHMPAGFTESLARRLDSRSSIVVREAMTGDFPSPGVALLAPGDRHMELDADGRISLVDGPREHGVRPAADRTIRSALLARPGGVDLVVLTGMGVDGTAGARLVKADGGWIIAESEATAVVWGMPRSVVEAGFADEVLPLSRIAARIGVGRG